MRVTLIVERFAPAGGGVEKVVWAVAHGLRDRGDQVRVLAREGSSASGIDLERIDVPSFWQPVRVSLFARRAAEQVAIQRGRDEVDVVHSFCRTPSQDVFHAGGGSHADYMQNTYGTARAALRRGSPRHALQLSLERRIFADESQVIQCPSAMVAREIAARFGVDADRLRVVRNGVEATRFGAVSAADAAGLRADLDGSSGVSAPAWLLAGSGWRRKGLDLALRALARCSNHGTRLWVAGSDPVREWRRLASRLGVSERVRFLGPRHDIERVMAAADGLLLPTRYDAFGLVCLESAAAGHPVVTSSRAGAAEILDGCGEVISNPEDVDAIVRALDRLEDPEERRRCGDAGRAVAARYDWPNQVDALRMLYREVSR